VSSAARVIDNQLGPSAHFEENIAMKYNCVAFNLRTTLTAALVMIGLLLGAPDAHGQQRAQKVPDNFNIVSIRITNVSVQDGRLFAAGLVGTKPFSDVPITLSTPGGLASSLQNGQACPILNLALGPIDVTLLGLQVQTSPICLDITAYEGGGLLGDLLCQVATLLQGGSTLSEVLALLEAGGQLGRLLQGTEELLNGALDALTSNRIGDQPTGRVAATCTILDLSLGPVELNLLGLEVILDNCAGGPVTVTITAIEGGGLLGDLLCSLSDLLQNQRGAPAAVQALLWQITRVLAGLLR
jgi:hypothetical protein